MKPNAIAARSALFEHVNHDRDLGILFRDVSANGLGYPWHFHPELELTHIVRGSGLRYVGDSIEPFADGDLCLIGGETPHCWLTELGFTGHAHARVIQFLPESIAASIAKAFLEEYQNARGKRFSRAERTVAAASARYLVAHVARLELATGIPEGDNFRGLPREYDSDPLL